MAKIKDITDEKVIFTDGSIIDFNHPQDCCEYNYADFFEGLTRGKDLTAEYDTSNANFLIFPKEKPYFCLLDTKGNRHKVMCFSEQNGYYCDIVDIYFNGEYVNEVDCKLIFV